MQSSDYVNVSAKLCDGGHVCVFPKECCNLGCCSYSTYPHMGNTIIEMLKFLFWYYWYLWVALLAGLVIAAGCGCWLCHKRRANMMDDASVSDRASTGSCYLPPHYSRCSSIAQAMPPPYNEVTAKPDLYPLVIGFDEGFGKGASGLVMRYFRSLSHASTLDSLSSSFMCNVVNEANTIIPPPYSCNNSVDELSSVGAAASASPLHGAGSGSSALRPERPSNFGDGSLVSLANQRTASDVSSLAAQSPLSPPRATSPTIEQQRSLSPSSECHPQGQSNGVNSGPRRQERTKRIRDKTYVSVSRGYPNSSSTAQAGPSSSSGMSNSGPGPLRTARSWLSRSAPTTPSSSGPSGLAAVLFGGALHHNHHMHHQYHHQQAVPLLLDELDETEGSGAAGDDNAEEATNSLEPVTSEVETLADVRSDGL
ncbi:hypothetical protein QAD02_018982 [Eretmocerus hayati]|uniref:Uncharacterized protein n=1 Tax=Eretmocerus hayati TaxID=131215 RepID=A0ACC2PN21_9HYME|nr:hypothetical protein QAD02_018982 [Eretmocerus hayati]